MYLIAIGWLYVALMMSLAEATNTNGSILGAIFTFLMYGVGPAALLMYSRGTPQRRRKRQAQEAEQAMAGKTVQEGAQGTTQVRGPDSEQGSHQPDAGREAPADPVSAVREKT